MFKLNNNNSLLLRNANDIIAFKDTGVEADQLEWKISQKLGKLANEHL